MHHLDSQLDQHAEILLLEEGILFTVRNANYSQRGALLPNSAMTL